MINYNNKKYNKISKQILFSPLLLRTLLFGGGEGAVAATAEGGEGVMGEKR